VVNELAPRDEFVELYDRYHALYRKLYPALQPHFKKLTRLIG